MFCKVNDWTLLAQAAYKPYSDKNVRITKRFETRDMEFLDRPKHEAKTVKELDRQIANSRLLPKSTDPF